MKNGKKNLSGASTDAAAACFKVRRTVIDVPEFLKAYGRELKRNLIDEHRGVARAGPSPREFRPLKIRLWPFYDAARPSGLNGKL
jgi:hypothetical protein